MHSAAFTKSVAIIGAGPAGMTAAYQLAKESVGVHVFEASDAIGGLSRTINLWDQKVDLGPHRFFSSDPRVNNLWLEVIGEDYEMVNRLTRIYYKGRFFHYPLKQVDALAKLGVFEAARCVASYLAQRLRRRESENCFEKWVIQRFGRRLFQIFFKTYSEKLWGIPCHALDSDFAAQRIKKLSLFEAVRAALFKNGAAAHKTLVEQFAYPKAGTGELYNRMADYVRATGGTVECQRPVQSVLLRDGCVNGVRFEDGEQRTFDEVISTMPLNQLVTRLRDVPADVISAAESLRFRSTILVFLKVEATNLFADNWLYVHSEDLRAGRITNFRNWVPQLYGESQSSILALEYWCNRDDSIWSQDDESLVALASRELRSTGLIKNAIVSAGHVHRIPRCYPVYSRGYKEVLKPVQDYLSTLSGLTVIGRYGAFKYNNQDHSILMGMLAAENISEGATHDLWAINTDYEYQERTKITKTGLVRERPETFPVGGPAPAAALRPA
jgi:protoporphyrinogen oxidase